jgi:peptidyl-Asp metalloendopeptidase
VVIRAIGSWRRRPLVLAASVVALIATTRPGVTAQDRRLLFSTVQSATERAADVRDARGRVRRSRSATADLAALTTVDRSSGLPNQYATSIDLNLFADADYVAQLERVEDLGGGRIAWSGPLIGVSDGRAILAISDGVLAGSVTTPDAAYEIRWQSDGSYQIEDVNRSSFAKEAEPLHVDTAVFAASDRESRDAADDGSTFDLMVAYTAAARAAAGGTAAMTSLIALGVAETNHAYAAVGLGARLRLVEALETSYVETRTAETDLRNIRANASIAARRDAVGADLVMLVIDQMTNACGIGYLMTSVTTAFASAAYTVVDRSCISPNYSFAHELGHNMGSNHAPEDGAVDGAYPYSFGFKNASAGFRTIMAYDCVPSCRRLLTFSTPNVAVGARPAGASSQDNARSLVNTRLTVANFRQSAAPSAAAPGAPSDLTTSLSGSTAVLSWKAPTTGGAPTAYVIEAGSASGLANLANFSTGNTATTFSANGFGAGIYYLRVRASNAAGTGGPSNESRLVVGDACASAPPPPIGFASTFNSGGTVSFAWTAAPGATTYVIEAGSAPGLSNLASADLGSASTSATFNGIGAGTYYVRLRARNTCGTSGVSNEATLVVR